MRKLLLSLSVFLAALGFATPALIHGFASAPDASATEARPTETEDETTDTPDPDALAAAKTNATNLVNYLKNVDGLFKEADVTTATEAIGNATDLNGVATAKNEFLAKIQATNVSVRSNNIKVEQVPQPDGSTVEKTFTGEYLCNHAELLDDNTFGTSVPHVHGTFGFASIFQLKWATVNDVNGISIVSNFDGTPDAIGPNGEDWTDCAWQIEYAEVEGTDGSTIMGVAFKNPNGLYLSTIENGATSELPGVELALNPSSVWTVTRVYLPVSMSFDSNSGTVIGGMTTTIKPTFISDGGDGVAVTPGLDGVVWSSSDSEIASVEGTNRYESMVPNIADADRNGYIAGEITGQAYSQEGNNEATITATSVMPASQSSSGKAISAEYIVTVTPGTPNEVQLKAAIANLKNLIDALNDAGVIADADITTLKNEINEVHYPESQATQEYDTPSNAQQALLPEMKKLMAVIDPTAPFTISFVHGQNTEYVTNMPSVNDNLRAQTADNCSMQSIWCIEPIKEGDQFTGNVYINLYGTERVFGPALGGTQPKSGNKAVVTLGYNTVSDNSGVTFYTTTSGNGYLYDRHNGNTSQTGKWTNNDNPITANCLWTLTKAVIPTAVSLRTSVASDFVTVTPTFTPVDATDFLQTLTYSYTDDDGTVTNAEVTDGKFATPSTPGEYTLTATSAAGVTVTPEGESTASTLTGTTTFTVQETLTAIAATFSKQSLSLKEGEDATVTVTLTPSPVGYVLDNSKLGVVIAAKDATEDTPPVTVKPDIADVDGNITIHIPAGLTKGEYTLSVTYDYTPLLTAEGTLAIAVTKDPLESIEAAFATEDVKTEFTVGYENDITLDVTLTTNPTAYTLDNSKLAVAIKGSSAELSIAPTSGGKAGTYTITIPTGLEVGEYTLEITYNEGGNDDTKVTANSGDDATPLIITIAKAPLAELTAAFVQDAVTSFTEGYETAVTLDVTLATKPENYILDASKLSVAIADNSTVTPSIAPKDGQEGVYTISIPTGLTKGEYTLIITYKEGDTDDTKVTANSGDGATQLTITIATPAITGITYQGVTDNAVEIKIAKSAENATEEIVIVAAPDGAVFTDKTITWAKAVADGETEPADANGISIEAKTVDGQAANQRTFTITASVVGTYTLTPSIDGVDGLQPMTVTVSKAEKDLLVSDIVAAPVADVILTQTDKDTYSATGTVTFTVSLGENSETLTKSNLKVDASDVAVGEITLAPTSETEYTVTVPFTATEATTGDAKASVTLTITGTTDETAPAETAEFAVVKPALSIKTITAPTETAEVKVGNPDLEAEFTVTVDEGSAWPTVADFKVEATGVEKGSIHVIPTSSPSPTVFDVFVAYTAQTAGNAKITLAAQADDTKTATATITVTEAGEDPTTDELPVTKPAEDPETPNAPEVEVTTENGKPAMTIDFNASPASQDGTAAKPVMTVTLPKNGDTDLTTFEAVVTDEDGNESKALTATITENGIEIDAAGAEIGDKFTITIKAATTTSQVSLTEGENDGTEVADGNNNGNDNSDNTDDNTDDNTGNNTPATNDAILTINVTIYGVEFTKAPSTATLGMDNTVKVTFDTKACTKDNSETKGVLSVEGAEVDNETGVITFTQAGTYTVTATAGNGKYVATTTIKVNEAPTVTGIEAVNADAAAGNATVYDLRGRRINRVNAAGIYIVNGVKTLVR